MSTLLFARCATFDPLLEYVQSLRLRTRWVRRYDLRSCLHHILAHHAVIVFLQMVPCEDLLQALKNKQVWILNTEQLSRLQTMTSEDVQFPFETAVLDPLQQKHVHGLMDYSSSNLQLFKSIFQDSIPTRLLEFQPMPPIVNQLKTKKIAFVGDASSSYRQEILSKLEKDVTVIQGVYGLQRDKDLYAHKVLINLHFTPAYSIFENLRCLPCVLAGMVVVSEISKIDEKHPIYPFVLFAPRERLVETAQYALANFDSLCDTLYKDNVDYANLLENIKLYNATF
jgi:hypothetical protein